jgi:CDP-paratose 2-epimerase
VSAREIAPAVPGGTTLITGGSGFIGSNLAHRIASGGGDVILFDNLARPSVHRNARWLEEQHGRRVELAIGDVRDARAVRRVVERADRVFHLAAQVAVTTSVVDPREDFEINAGGTINVLEAIRAEDRDIPLFFTSTNKVYGALSDIDLELRSRRWTPSLPQLEKHGVSESRPLDFHSPYGCSKGTADQYVLDWARSYGLASVVFRMSCIYGPRQFGTEDQGWVAHFLIRAMRGEPIVIYGDGMQVRDLLFVDDLVDAFLGAHAGLAATRGHAFNVGGGASNVTSLVELLDLAHQVTGRRVDTLPGEPRVGDQRWYVSDPRALERAIGWRPRTSVQRGVERLVAWLRDPASRAAPAEIVRGAVA